MGCDENRVGIIKKNTWFELVDINCGNSIFYIST